VQVQEQVLLPVCRNSPGHGVIQQLCKSCLHKLPGIIILPYCGIQDPIPVYPIVLLRVAGCMTGFMDLKGFLPELDGDNNTFFVTTSVILVLDIIHYNHISPVREYSFSTGNRSVLQNSGGTNSGKNTGNFLNSSSTIPVRRLKKGFSRVSHQPMWISLTACSGKSRFIRIFDRITRLSIIT
jgi:hypothetical protein